MNATEAKTYNGCAQRCWRERTNYETWAVKLWMEPSYRYFLDLARTADSAYELMEQIKSEHEEQLPELKGFAGDLLCAAFSEVNWYEIAETLFAEAREDA